MIAYTVWSEAGGVGKTTLAANLLRAHANRGQSVLGIDMDPQDGGLTHHLGLDGEKADSDADNLVLHMLGRGRGDFDDFVRSCEGIDLVPSHNMLGRLADLLGKAAEIEEETHPDSDYKGVPVPLVGAFAVLVAGLAVAKSIGYGLDEFFSHRGIFHSPWFVAASAIITFAVVMHLGLVLTIAAVGLAVLAAVGVVVHLTTDKVSSFGS